MTQFPPGPLSISLRLFQIFRTVEIFAKEYLSQVSMTPAINHFHGFSVIAGVINTGITSDIDTDNDTDKQFLPVSLTLVINLSPVTMIPWGLFFLKNCEPHCKNKNVVLKALISPAVAADSVMGTAMTRCIHSNLTRPIRSLWNHQNYFKP